MLPVHPLLPVHPISTVNLEQDHFVFTARFVIALRVSLQISTKTSSAHFSCMRPSLGAAKRCHLDQKNDRSDRSPLNVNTFSHSVLT